MQPLGLPANAKIFQAALRLRAPQPRRVDADFAERVRSETVYRHAGRYCLWSALVFVAALVFMFFTFATSLALGFVGVVVMFLSGVVFANNARRMGKAGIDDISRSLHTRSISNPVHDPRDWIRGRFHRDD